MDPVIDTVIDTVSTVKLTSWPSPQDYNEAVQNPRITLTDAELKLGQPELSELGLPRPRSGNFATVYKIVCSETNWAVRCFLHGASGQKERYTAIERALSSMKSEMTVPFAYLEEGLHVGNHSYPILKMEWAQGQTLDEFIRANLTNPEKIAKAASWVKELNLALRDRGIAHGDLQHGNILVGQSGMKIVDYDGMFVPEFVGCESPELGHRNYQHPSRTARDFNAQLDNFAAWTIYVSLICLSEDPDLWRTLGGGDDCLLFRHDDFVQPKQSYAFCTLENHKSEVVRSQSRVLRSLLSLKLDDVPFLDAPITTSEALPEFSPEAWFPINMPPELKTKSKQEQVDWIESYRAAMSSPGGIPGPAVHNATGVGTGLGTRTGAGSAAGSAASSGSTSMFVPRPAPLSTRWSLAIIFTACIVSLLIDTALTVHPASHQSPPISAAAVRAAVPPIAAAGDGVGADIENPNVAAVPTSTADKLFQRAMDERERGTTRLAIELFQQAIKKYDQLNTAKTPQTRQLAQCWHFLAHAQSELYERDAAARSIAKSVEYYKQLGDKEALKTVEKDQKYGP